MAYIHDLNFRKVFGLCKEWVILKTKSEYDTIVLMCEEARIQGPPKW